MSSLNHLLSHIVDYAGLFPPAALPLEEVVKNYNDYISSDDEWMLARLIIPASRLSEFVEVADSIVDSQTMACWLISALLPAPSDEKFAGAVEAILEFNRQSNERSVKAVVDAVELPTPQTELIDQAVAAVHAEISVFAELPWDENHEHFSKLAELRKGRSNLFAKIRTGGVEPQMIPSVAQVASFIESAQQHAVGFKATAGLHHPLRAEYALTYESNSPRGTMHGFMNVFAGACLVHHKRISSEDLVALLNEADSTAIKFDEAGLVWRECSVSREEIERTRGEFAISFGSCSFTEPLEDLATHWPA